MGFDPASLAIEASLGSAAMGAVGQIQQSRAQSAAAGYNARVADINAKTELQNAGFAGAEGESRAGMEGLKTRAQAGALLTKQGASGIDVNSKSFGDVRTSQAEIGKLNALQIRSNAARQAYGFQTGATSQENQATLDRAQAKYDTTAGYVNAGTTVLGGLAQAALYSHMMGSDPTNNLTNINNEDTQSYSGVGADMMKQLYPGY